MGTVINDSCQNTDVATDPPTQSMSSMSGSSQSEREMTVNCDYGLRAKRFTSWTEANPGRRFDTCTKVILIMFHVKLMWLLCVFG